VAKDAGIVVQDVDPTKPINRLADEPVQLGHIGHVHRNRQRLATGHLDVPGSRFGQLGTHVRDHDVGAFASKAQRNRASDAAPGACNNRDLIQKPHWILFLL
jgi:hypothetical protein